ncbi:MAG: class I SAM-dependent methyltransferase [Rhodospirillaceae bacterium]|nr:class I SAM-dependent methyltransferase [Rhodospirillaceae bacterium]
MAAGRLTPLSEAADHYRTFPPRDSILAALARRGHAPDTLTPDRLAPFDQLHTGGAPATAALIARLAPNPADHVLDVGSGLGGPARMLAARTGCRVTGIDITPRFVADATFFTACTGQPRVSFQEGSATALPFGDRSFDAAWHIHMAMNVADKAAMYAEIFRVLKPGAAFAIDDPVRGEGEMVFPVPWAAEPRTSYLCTAEALVDLLAGAGFVAPEIEDVTAQGIAFALERERARDNTRPLSAWEAMSANHRANMVAGAVRVISVVMKKP